MKRALVVVLAVVSSLAGFAAAGSTDAAATLAPGVAERIGFSSHLVWRGEAEQLAELAEIRAGGLGWVREDFSWDRLEPARGVFDWTVTDRLMRSTSKVGIDVLAVLGYSARWASSDPTGGGDVHYPPRNPAEYAAFAAAVAARYGPGGAFWVTNPSLTPRPLRAVELWNEPWGYWFWKPGPDPAAYAGLALAAATAVRAANPSVEILLSGDLNQSRADGSNPPWLDDVLAAEPALAAVVDAYSVHPYPWPKTAGPYDRTLPPHDQVDRVALVRDVAAARGAAKPLWVTEVGWTTAASSRAGVSEAAQAEYVAGTARLALTEWPFVERTFLYTWGRDGTDPSDMEQWFGLHRADGSAKPAWPVLQDALAKLAGTPAPSVEPLREVGRLAGPTRFDTAAAVSAAGWTEGAAHVMLASGMSYPDALGAGASAAERDAPLLLSEPCRLPTATVNELHRLRPTTVTVVGGPAVVCDGVLDAVRAITGGSVARIAGADRFATAALVARSTSPTAATVVVASGETYADGISGGALAARLAAPLLLTGACTLPVATADALATIRPERIVIMGGVHSICPAVADALGVTTRTERVAGADRYATSVAAARLGWPEGVTQVFVSGGTGFADGLSVTPLAGRRGAPLVLVGGCDLPLAVGALLGTLETSSVTVVGGSGSVCTAVEGALATAS